MSVFVFITNQYNILTDNNIIDKNLNLYIQFNGLRWFYDIKHFYKNTINMYQLKWTKEYFIKRYK